jgi:hypothetical protein
MHHAPQVPPLWEYIDKLLEAAWEFAKGGGELIEFLILAVIFLAPGLREKVEEKEVRPSKSIRKILLWKFCHDEKWRAMVVFIAGLTFHFLVIAPYLAFKEVKSEIPKPESTIVKWAPPKIVEGYPQFTVLFGGSFSGDGYMGSPWFIDFKKAKSPAGALVPIGMNGFIAHCTDNRIFLNVDIPTERNVVEIREGESVNPLPDGWDFNSADNALEIVDDQNRAVFQEIYRGTNTFWVRGAIQDTGEVVETSDAGGVEHHPHSTFKGVDFYLTPMFLYPSSKYPSKRVPK